MRVEMIDLDPRGRIPRHDRFKQLAGRDSPVIAGKGFGASADDWREISELIRMIARDPSYVIAQNGGERESGGESGRAAQFLTAERSDSFFDFGKTDGREIDDRRVREITVTPGIINGDLTQYDIQQRRQSDRKDERVAPVVSLELIQDQSMADHLFDEENAADKRQAQVNCRGRQENPDDQVAF